MAPVVITCDGCGIRIRIAKPEAALGRSCPRCSAPLVSAIAKAFDSQPQNEAPSPLGINFEPPPESEVETQTTWEPEPRSSGATWLAACVCVLGATALSLGLWLTHHGATPKTQVNASAAPDSAFPTALRLAHKAPIRPDLTAEIETELASPPQARESIGPVDPSGETTDSRNLDAEPTRPVDQAEVTIASRESLVPRFEPQPEPASTPPPPPRPELVRSSLPAPAPPEPQAPSFAPPTRDELSTAQRVRIRTQSGETVIARVHGQADGKVSVLLPNGELGFTTGTAETEEPFVPATMDQIHEQLIKKRPFADFKVLKSEHYLVLYQSSTPFAQASIKLLESLYKNLLESFKKRELPVHNSEFPLVAIIFRTEAEFRAYQPVDPDVQAYYEILSNRIYLYEKSDHDQQSPEVAAMRKPQTVAHEGTHQILQNIGIHPRLAPWPLWLVEGFAEYCSPPTMTRRGATWGGLGQVNPMHMATINDLDDPAALYVGGSERKRLGRDRSKPLVEYLVTRPALTPTDYALSWALTHYLATKRGTEFLAFIQTMSKLPPLEERTPDKQLAAFREAFGPDLAKMDKTIATYLAKLKYDPLPYYAVVFEQPIPGNQLRRAAIVSQSPSMIRQWLGQISDANGGATSWEAFPHATRSRAQLAAEQWMQNR